MTNPPIAYSPDIETPEADETATRQALSETMHDILEITSQDYDHAVRSVHAKGLALFDGTLEVIDGLPTELAQGLFARAGRYAAVLRFSTIPGDILHDAVSGPRGLALKVIGVDGDRLPGSEGDAMQDFVMVNSPAFAAPTAKKFLGNLKLLAKTTDKAEWAKKALSSTLQVIESALEAVGGKSATLSSLGGAPNVHPLGETYYSQTPFRYGDYVAKFALFPVAPWMIAITGEVIDPAGRADAIREDMATAIADKEAQYELRVQLRNSADTQPIEDASMPWDEAESPFVTVARLTVPAQSGWSEDDAAREDALAFSVWHGLAAHRPLGSVNRVRQSVYEMSAEFRSAFNGCPIHEPRVREGART